MHNGTEVSVEGIISADALMAGYRIIFINVETQDTLELFDDILQQTQYNVHYHWYPQVSSTQRVEVKLQGLSTDKEVLGSTSTEIICTP